MDERALQSDSAGISALRTTGAALLLAAALGACNKDAPAPPANQADVAPTGMTAPSPAPPMADATAPAADADAATVIPEDVHAIWADIDKHQADLASVVATGDLAQTHHHAFAIRDLLAAVPAHAATMSAEDRAVLDKNIVYVATLSARLDSAGDSGDRAGAQAAYAQLAKVLADTPRTK